MRWLASCFILVAAACGSASTATPGLNLDAGGCVPMPTECPETLACDVATIVGDDGNESRVCGGRACCQSFCELNGCSSCCVTPFP